MISIRTFTTSLKRLNREPGVSQAILDLLKDSSKLKKHQDVIVLNPYKYHTKKKIKRNTPVINFASDNLPLFINESEPINDEDSFIKLINNMKISDTLLTERKIKLIIQKLSNSFSKLQLNQYIETYYNDKTFTGPKRGLKSKSKSQLSSIILKDLWQVKQSGIKSSAEDLLISYDIDLQKKDLFLLLSKDGILLTYLSRTGCKITFDSKLDKLKFTGTEDQITTTRIILETMLNHKYEEVLNLKLIKELYLEKYGEFNLNRLSKLTQVYFEPLHNDNYKLISLNSNLIKRAKRTILWFLDSNPNIKNTHLVPSMYGKDYKYLPVKIDESLTFNERSNDLFRLSKSYQHANNYIEQQLKHFNKSDLNDDELQDLTYNLLNNSTFDNPLSDYKISNTTDANIGNNFIVNNNLQETTVPDDHEKILNDEEIDEIYNNLKNFDKQNSFIEHDKLMDPQITISFGNILLETPKTNNNLIPMFNDNSNATVKFNSSIPLINDKILNLPLYDYPHLNYNDIIDFKNNDPYRSVIQLTFQPSLYNTDNKDLIKYPPVEMWADINNFGKIEMDTFQLLTAEDENNYLISLPDKSSDVKVSSQLIGNLLKDHQQHDQPLDDELSEALVNKLSIEEMLKSTTLKYSNFKQQPYLEEFLANSTINFKGSQRTNIQPTINIQFGDQVVEYQYISSNFRRVIEFMYKDKLLQYTIIEGGPLGGTRSEINLSGKDFTKDTLKELIDDSIQLVNQL